ncbi:MAG: nucleoside monophosphate kinase [Patescibacteria group bacterium]|jgi:adenylate kinase
MSTTIFSFLGAPGSGKGTQAQILVQEYGFKHIVTGDLVRAQKEKASESLVAKEIAERYDKGIPQPDDVVKDLVLAEAERSLDTPGIILDPFPLSLGQADILEAWSQERPSQVSGLYMVYFVISEEESVKRLLLRAGKEGRTDDKEGIIRFRYKEYVKRADELKSYYTKRKKYIEIDGTPKIEEVAANMKKVLSDHHLLEV